MQSMKKLSLSTIQKVGEAGERVSGRGGHQGGPHPGQGRPARSPQSQDKHFSHFLKEKSDNILYQVFSLIILHADI